VLSGTIKKRESFVPETIKKRLESYPGWSDLVRRRKKTPPMQLHGRVKKSLRVTVSHSSLVCALAFPMV